MTQCDDIYQVIDKKLIKSLFQPIVATHTREVVAFEALSRGPSASPLYSPLQLFDEARERQCLVALENVCRSKAVEAFSQQQLSGRLFLNVTPDTLMQVDHKSGQTKQLLERFGLRPEQVVIELTEHSPTVDYQVMRKAVEHYRAMGFAIALDDLGAGYSGLRLWSELTPELVKIDRHFISNIDREPIKRDFVRFIIEIARAVNSQVVAEGIETREECELLSQLGVDYLQGYYLAQPAEQPVTQLSPQRRHAWSSQPLSGKQRGDEAGVEQLLLTVPPVTPSTSVERVMQLLEQNPSWYSLPVVEKGRPLGLVARTRLLSLLSQPYGRELFCKKSIAQVMDSAPLCVDRYLRLEQVSQLITNRCRARLEDDFIITDKGRYAGIGQVVDLLKQITELQVRSAQHANPLTMLPGNVPIHERIDHHLQADEPFVVCYFDLDHFKPFNDTYGYAQGDEILLLLARLISSHVNPRVDFVGHVGGDDFVVVFRSENWQQRVQAMLDEFAEGVRKSYAPEHQQAGGIWATDRFGEQRFFPQVCVSVGAIAMQGGSGMNAKGLASQMSKIKHKAKEYEGNSIVLASGFGQMDILTSCAA